MNYEEDTELILTFGILKELLYAVQEDGVDSDGGAFPLVYENLDQIIMNKIEKEKTIAIVKQNVGDDNFQ